MDSDISMSSSSRVTLEKYQQIEASLQQGQILRKGVDEHLAAERSQIDKIQAAYQDLLRAFQDVCIERDQLKGGQEPKGATTSDDLESLRAETETLKSELAQTKEELAQSKEQLANLSAKYQEERQNWTKFRNWWDEALAAKKGRSSSAKKPRLNANERQLIDKVGLATPNTTTSAASADNRRAAHTRVRASDQTGDGSPAVVQRKTNAVAVNAAAAPVTPITRPTVSLLSTDPQRMRHWLDHVDQHPPNSSDPVQQDDSTTARPPARSREQNADITIAREQADRTSSAGSKRRRLSEPDEEVVASSREPLVNLSPNDTHQRSQESARRLRAQGGERSKTSSKQKSPPARNQGTRRITPIKAESDDECARDCAIARTQSSATRAETPQEVPREELLRRRKAEMEDLRNNPWKYRGRGRYAAELQRSEHRAGRLTLRPELNGGAAYEHNDVVRDRSTRKRMHAHDCPCCKDYWDLVGPAAEGSTVANRGPSSSLARRGGLARRSVTDGNVTVVHIESDDEDDHVATQARRRRTGADLSATTDLAFSKRQRQRERDLAILEEEREQDRLAQERRQRAGRHRAWGRPAATPEGFWEISFPDTPRRDAINDSARKQREQKMAAMANDPRYRRRGA